MSFVAGIKRLLGASSVAEMDALEARRLQAEGQALLVDVREAHEWRDGHAPQARHVPLAQLAARVGSLPRDRAIVLVCARGARSRRGARVLAEAGFARVASLRGGMAAWRAAGLPTRK